VFSRRSLPLDAVPKQMRAWRKQGYEHMYVRSWQQAIQFFWKNLRCNPKSFECWADLTWCYAHTDNPDRQILKWLLTITASYGKTQDDIQTMHKLFLPVFQLRLYFQYEIDAIGLMFGVPVDTQFSTNLYASLDPTAFILANHALNPHIFQFYIRREWMLAIPPCDNKRWLHWERMALQRTYMPEHTPEASFHLDLDIAACLQNTHNGIQAVNSHYAFMAPFMPFYVESYVSIACTETLFGKEMTNVREKFLLSVDPATTHMGCVATCTLIAYCTNNPLMLWPMRLGLEQFNQPLRKNHPYVQGTLHTTDDILKRMNDLRQCSVPVAHTFFCSLERKNDPEKQVSHCFVILQVPAEIPEECRGASDCVYYIIQSYENHYSLSTWMQYTIGHKTKCNNNLFHGWLCFDQMMQFVSRALCAFTTSSLWLRNACFELAFVLRFPFPNHVFDHTSLTYHAHKFDADLFRFRLNNLVAPAITIAQE